MLPEQTTIIYLGLPCVYISVFELYHKKSILLEKIGKHDWHKFV